MSSPRRVVVAGLGDTGILAAVRLARRADVVGISTKPALVSGQELGWRLCRPDDWARDNWITFDRFRGLDRVRTIHGALAGVDFAARRVTVHREDGSSTEESYDTLVITTGVTNGFWRTSSVQSLDEVSGEIRTAHARLTEARSVIVVGGGMTAISSAAQVAAAWPDKKVDLYFPGQRALPSHHPRIWAKVVGHLVDLGVVLHPGHRAEIPTGFLCDELTCEPVRWRSGQPPSSADVVLWAIGKVRPNTDWLPDEVLDGNRFVRVTRQLQVPGHPEVFAVGDVAATDPLRTSARNFGYTVLAHNVRAQWAGRPLRSYRPPHGHWGSVLGVQSTGVELFTPRGKTLHIPAAVLHRVLQPVFNRGIAYGGVRRDHRPVTLAR